MIQTITAAPLNFSELDNLKISDLIGIPYKEHGRTLAGLDCYGAGIFSVYILIRKKLRDVIYFDHSIELAEENAPLLNVRKKTDSINTGDLIEIQLNGELHIGTALDSKRFIHATYNQGVRISTIKAYPVINVYEVLDDGHN